MAYIHIGLKFEGEVINPADINQLMDNEEAIVDGSKPLSYLDDYLADYLDSRDTIVYKGDIDCTTNPNYPAADAGWLYIISAPGKIGGVAGKSVILEDTIICIVDGSQSGPEGTVGANWILNKQNIVGAVTNSGTGTVNNAAVFANANGKIIKDSLVTITPTGSVTLPTGQSYNIGLSNIKDIIIPFGSDASGSDNYVVILSAEITSYTRGMLINFIPSATNAGAATLTVSGLATKDIRKNGTEVLTDGDIIYGKVTTVCYDGTNFQLIGSGGISTDHTPGANEVPFWLTSSVLSSGANFKWDGVTLSATNVTASTTINSTSINATHLKIAKIYPAVDSTDSIQINKANNATSIIVVNTSNGRVGINRQDACYTLDVNGTTRLGNITGMLKGSTGLITTGIPNVDYINPYVYSLNCLGTVNTGLNGIVKASSGCLSCATAGIDYIAGGSGSDAQVSYFTCAGILSGSRCFMWDHINSRLGIGTYPNYTLEVIGDIKLNTLNGILKGSTGLINTATPGIDYLDANGTSTQISYFTGNKSLCSNSSLTWNGSSLVTCNIETCKLFPATDAINSIQITKANGATPVIIVDTSNGRVGIGNTNPNSLLSLGGYGGVTGTISLYGDSGYTIIKPASIVDTYTLTLPSNNGDACQVLTTDGSGVLSWTAASPWVTCGYNLYYIPNLVNNGNVGIGTTDPTELLSLGSPGVRRGVISLASGGTCTKTILQAAHTSSNYTLTLPASTGSCNQTIVTDGSGNLSWTDNKASQWTTSGSNIYFCNLPELGAGSVGIGNSNPSGALLVLGTSGISRGTVSLNSRTSGYVTIAAPQTTTSSYIFTLPTSTGLAGQILTTDGYGCSNWITNGASQWTTSVNDIYYNIGKVGIGTTTPNNTIQVANLINFDSTCFNTAIGFRSLVNNVSGCYNTSLGECSSNANTTGCYNISIGHEALKCQSTDSNNIAIGYRTLISNNGGTNNVALGNLSLKNTTNGSNNVAIGNNVLRNANVNNNTGIGINALYCNCIGADNTSIGYNSLYSNQTGSYNVAFGSCSLYSNQTGAENTAIGWKSLYCTSTGRFNIGLGEYSLYNNISGCDNIAIGNYAGLNELGSCTLYVDMFQRGCIECDKAQSLLYGTFHSTNEKCQTLNINANLGIFSGVPSEVVSIGRVGTHGTLSLSGATSGKIIIRPNYNAGSYTLTLPPNEGSLCQLLTTDGHGVLSWTSTGYGGGGVPSSQWTTSGSDIYYCTGKVGIGLINPNNTLQVKDLINFDNTYYNTFVGHCSGNTIAGGCYNTAFGTSTLFANTTGCFNTAIGMNSLFLSCTGNYNIGIGAYAGSNETGSCNFYVNPIAKNCIECDRAESLLYGTFFALATCQQLTVNGSFNVNSYSDDNSSLPNTWAATIKNSGTTNAHGLYVCVACNSTGIPLSISKGSCSYLQIINNGNIGIANSNPSELLALGTAGCKLGVLSFAGSTCGKIIIQSPTSTNNYTLTLPTSTGSCNQVLTTNGSGVLTWTTPASTSSQWTTSGSDIYYCTGKVGIGVTNPNSNIQVKDLINFDNTYGNTFLGYQAGCCNSGGLYNIALGCHTLLCNVNGTSNTAIGNSSLLCNSCGDQNIAIGTNSLSNNDTGDNNIAIGNLSLYCNISGESNTAIGRSSLFTTTGSNNIALGYYAGYYETGSCSFYINSLDRNCTTCEKVQSLMYGTFNTNAACQTLTINGALTVTTSLSTKGNFKLINSSTGYIGLRANTSTGNITYTLPKGDGSSGQVLSTNGSGTLSWATKINSQWTTSGSDIYYCTGKVGIGVTNPSESIQVNDLIYFCNSAYNTFIGYQVGCSYTHCPDSNTGFYNTGLGYNSLYSLTIGENNTAIGESSLYCNTTGVDNIALGMQSAFCNTEGNYNVAIGSYSLNSIGCGSNNIAIGYNAGYYETGNCSFYLNTISRDCLECDKAQSLLYGTFHTNACCQTLQINGKIGFYGQSAITQPEAITIASTEITYTSTGSLDYVIQDLTATGGYGFVTKDEGTAILSVIKNMQIRMLELENKLTDLGLLSSNYIFITFDKNEPSATGTMANQAIQKNSSANLNTNAFSTSYAFLGWSTTALGGVEYIDQASFTAGTINVTLYAVWDIPG